MDKLIDHSNESPLKIPDELKKDDINYKKELISLYIDLYREDKIESDGIGCYRKDPILKRLQLYNKLIELIPEDPISLSYGAVSIRYEILEMRRKVIKEQKTIAKNIFENYLQEPLPDCLIKSEKDE